MANQLVKKTAVYLIGNFASKAVNVVILPLYAFFVTEDALGTFDYYQSLMSILSPLAFVSIWDALLRFVLVEKKSSIKDDSISTIFFFAIAMAAIVGVIAIVGFFCFFEHSHIIAYVGTMTLCYAMGQLWQYSCRAMSKTKLYAMSGFVATIINFFLILVLVCILDMQLNGLCISFCVGQIAIILIIEWRIKLLQHVHLKRLNFSLLKKYVRYSMPLAVNLVILAINSGFGRIVVMNVLGASEAGLFTYALKFGGIISAIGSIFSMAVVEEAILRADDPSASTFFESISKGMSMALISLGIISLPVIKIFYGFIADTGFATSIAVVPYSVANGVILTMGTALGSIFSVVNKTDYVAYTSLVGCIISVVAACLMLSPWGIVGVGAAMMLGSFCLLITRIIGGIKLIHYRFHIVSFSALCAFYALATIFFFLTINSFDFVTEALFALVVLPFVPVALRGLKLIKCIPDRDKNFDGEM